MKRINGQARFAVLTLVLMFLFVGCMTTPSTVPDADRRSDSAVGQDTSWEDIQAKGVVVVGLDDAFPPMGFRSESGELIGFDIELAKAAIEKMGLKVEFKPIDWGSKMMELDNGNVDLLWNGFSITPEREEQVLFTKPYLENRQVIVVKKGTDIRDKAGLAGRVVAVQSASAAEDAVKADAAVYQSIGDKNIKRYADYNSAMLDLEVGRVQAVVLDEVVCRYYMSKKADMFEILEENFGEEFYGIGARKDEKAFVVELQKALDELKRDGTASAISIKWFGEDVVK